MTIASDTVVVLPSERAVTDDIDDVEDEKARDGVEGGKRVILLQACFRKVTVNPSVMGAHTTGAGMEYHHRN